MVNDDIGLIMDNLKIPIFSDVVDDTGHAILQDFMDELRPENVFKDVFKDVVSELSELKPSRLLKSIILGE